MNIGNQGNKTPHCKRYKNKNRTITKFVWTYEKSVESFGSKVKNNFQDYWRLKAYSQYTSCNEVEHEE